MIKNFIEVHRIESYGIFPTMVNYKRLLYICSDENGTRLGLNEGSHMFVTETYEEVVNMIEKNNQTTAFDWHDLKINPNDLPTKEGTYLCYFNFEEVYGVCRFVFDIGIYTDDEEDKGRPGFIYDGLYKNYIDVNVSKWCEFIK